MRPKQLHDHMQYSFIVSPTIAQMPQKITQIFHSRLSKELFQSTPGISVTGVRHTVIHPRHHQSGPKTTMRGPPHLTNEAR